MRVVAIGAHPDDVETGCGGALLRHAKEGGKIFVIIMSDGAYADYDNKPLRTAEQGRNEAERAMKVIGARYVILDFKTKSIPFSVESIEAINRFLDAERPDIIYTSWVHDTHQDHRSTALSTVSAGRNFGSVLMYEPVSAAGVDHSLSDSFFSPRLFIETTDFMEAKAMLLRAHTSQFRRYGEQWIDSMRARASFRGSQIGVKYAEGFEVLKFLWNP